MLVCQVVHCGFARSKIVVRGMPEDPSRAGTVLGPLNVYDRSPRLHGMYIKYDVD